MNTADTETSPLLLPVAKRKASIITKLNYADERRVELTNEVMSAKAGDRAPKHLVHIVEDILGNSRECFDLLGNDLLEAYILPALPKKKQEAFAQGRLRFYFPFHLSQVINRDAPIPIYALKAKNRPLYDMFFDFARAVGQNLPPHGTTFDTAWFIELKDIVNAKKHGDLLQCKIIENGELMVKDGDATFVFSEPLPPGLQLNFSEKAQARTVAAYRLAYNKREVCDFCGFSVGATRHVMDMFYDRFFQSSARVTPPSENVAGSVDGVPLIRGS